LDTLRGLPTSPDWYGLVHTDIHHGNFFLHDGRLVVFDFDDCHYRWFAFDLMIPLFYALRDAKVDENDVEYARRFMTSFLAGYRDETELNPEWLAHLQTMLKYREMELYCVLLLEGVPEGNNWCQRLLHNRQRRIEERLPVIDLDFRQFA
jgi:Ser/Thr protein kinase RdoA (MazF antagonist)